jgi:hypothetical protein
MAFENLLTAAGFPMVGELSCLLEDIAFLTEVAGRAPETEIVAFRRRPQKTHRSCQRRCPGYWISCATLPRLGLDYPLRSFATWDVVMTNRICKAPDEGWEPRCCSPSWSLVVPGSLARLLRRRLALVVGCTSCHGKVAFPPWTHPSWALPQKWLARRQRRQ